MSRGSQLTGAARANAERKAASEAAKAEAAAAAENEAEVSSREGAAPVAPEPTPSQTDVQRIAQSIVDTIPPAQAETQAAVAHRASKHSGDEAQAELEAEVARLLYAKGAQHKRDQELALARRHAHAPAPLHRSDFVPSLGGSIPHTITRASWVIYHTTPDVPDNLAVVLRRLPKHTDGNRYQADLFVFPQISGSDGHTVEGATYGLGEKQFSELPDDEDEWGLAPGKTYDSVRTWRHE